MSVGVFPIVNSDVKREAKTCVSFRKLRIKLRRCRRSLDRGAKTFDRRQNADNAEPGLVIRESAICMGVVRVSRDRAMKEQKRPCQMLFGH
jgi:hypothetical protein